MDVVAPIPSVSTAIAVSVNPGLRRSVRVAANSLPIFPLDCRGKQFWCRRKVIDEIDPRVRDAVRLWDPC